MKECADQTSCPYILYLNKTRANLYVNNELQNLKKAATKLKRRSLDLQDMIKHSNAWPPASNQRLNRKEEDKESVSGDWVDKIMVNRNDSLTSDDSIVGQWEAESKLSSPMRSPSSLSDPSRINLDDSDDQLDVATTSDSSESDLLWQLHSPKPTSIPSVIGSKAKKPINLRPAKTPETR